MIYDIIVSEPPVWTEFGAGLLVWQGDNQESSNTIEMSGFEVHCICIIS